MATMLIFIGILCIIAGIIGRKEQKRRDSFEDYVWFHFEDHGWNEDKRKKKK